MPPVLPPSDTRTARNSYVSSLIKTGDVGAEIGSWQGTFAYYTLLQKQPSKLFLIDPWTGAASDPDRGLQTPEARRARNDIYVEVCRAFAPYPNVVVLRMKSEDAAAHFPDRFFDYVYVDGDHSYEGVTKDLVSFFPKVKPGGLIIGDDYGWGDVSIAVQAFIKSRKDDLLWLGDPLTPQREGQFAFKRNR